MKNNERIQPTYFIQPMKEMTMQKNMKRFVLTGMMSLFLSPVMAYSQGLTDLADIDWSQHKMPPEEAEKIAKGLFHEDISAGRLTVKQAGEYFKCTEEDYADAFSNNPEAKKYRETLERMKKYEEMSKSEKAKQDAEMNESAKAMEKLRGESEDKCVKKLGLKTTPGKASASASTK